MPPCGTQFPVLPVRPFQFTTSRFGASLIRMTCMKPCDQLRQSLATATQSPVLAQYDLDAWSELLRHQVVRKITCFTKRQKALPKRH
eukprot:3466239-Amphidinium_carterae.1